MQHGDDKTRRSPGRPKQNNGGLPMRETVLNTASRLFLELGYEPVSLNMIAERAGVTKASVYYYFSNKAGLFAASVIELFTRIRLRTKALLEGEGSLKERLILLARTKLSSIHMDFESMMREAAPSLSAEQMQGIRKAEHGVHEELDEAFRIAMDRGELAQGDPMLLSHAFSALLMLGNREELGDRKPSVEELARELVELLWNGAAKR